MTDKNTYKKELNKVSNELNELSKLLISQLEESPIEYINLYQYIDIIDTLTIKKNKLLYLIATDIK